MIIRSLLEQHRPLALPALEGVDGRSAFQDGLRQLAVVEPDVAQNGLFEILAAAEVVALEHVLDPAVYRLDKAVGLGAHGRGQAVLNLELGAELVEIVVAGGGAAAQAEQPVGELLAVACWKWSATGGYGRARSPQIAQRAAITGAQVSMVVLRTTPSRRPDYGQDPEYP